MIKNRRTMPRFIGSRRAISTILANVLVVIIVVSLGTTLFIWTTGVMGAYQGGAGVWFSTRSEVMKERLAIEEVWFTGPDHMNITIYVRNVGANEVKIGALYVNSTQVSTWNGPTVLHVGQVGKFSLTIPVPPLKPWGNECVTYISVATLRGNVVKGYW
nr:hypothetical protein [Candidatus Njordarchaeum guaymaensis]